MKDKIIFRLFAVAALVAVVLFASGNVASAQGFRGRGPGFGPRGGFGRGPIVVNNFNRGFGRFGGFGRPVVVNGFGFGPFGFNRFNRFGAFGFGPRFVPVPVGVPVGNGLRVNGFGVNAFGVNPFFNNGFNQFGVGGFAAPGCF